MQNHASFLFLYWLSAKQKKETKIFLLHAKNVPLCVFLFIFSDASSENRAAWHSSFFRFWIFRIRHIGYDTTSRRLDSKEKKEAVMKGTVIVHDNPIHVIESDSLEEIKREATEICNMYLCRFDHLKIETSFHGIPYETVYTRKNRLYSDGSVSRGRWM